MNLIISILFFFNSIITLTSFHAYSWPSNDKVCSTVVNSFNFHRINLKKIDKYISKFKKRIPQNIVSSFNGGDFYLQATIKGLPAGLRVTLTDDWGKDGAGVIAKTTTYNGGFKIHARLSEPIVVSLEMKTISKRILIEPGILKMTGNYPKDEFKFQGMKSESDYESFLSSDLSLWVYEYDNTHNRGGDEDIKEQKMDSIRRIFTDTLSKTIAPRTNAYASAYFLDYFCDIFKSPVDIEPYFKILSKEVQQSRYGKLVLKNIENAKKTAIGIAAPNFTTFDVDSNKIYLSDYKGKYVLLDFWASWCIPCREENPFVLEAYKTYHKRNFEVLSISLDDSKKNCLEAIKDDGLSWEQVCDLKAWKSELAKLYGVESIPANFLIDPSGKIVAKGLRGLDLFRKLRKIFN